MLNPQAQVRGPEQPPGVAPGCWAVRSLLACNLGLSFRGWHPDVGPGLQPLSVLVRAPTSGLPPTGTTYPQAARPGVMLKRGLPGIGAGEGPRRAQVLASPALLQRPLGFGPLSAPVPPAPVCPAGSVPSEHRPPAARLCPVSGARNAHRSRDHNSRRWFICTALAAI